MNRQDTSASVPLDILVLMGGPSNEREVSLLSGAAVAEALESMGHRVRRGDIHPTDPSALDGPRVDAVFIAMHGEFGEDGQVQRLCAQRGLAYVGSPPKACETAMDKAAAKTLMRKAGIATPDWRVIEQFESPAQYAADLEALGLPCVLKPITGGSSLDVFIVADAESRREKLDYLLDTYTRAMAERFVPGREFTDGVLGDAALPVLEIVADGGSFYDYNAKYIAESTRYLFDHGLDEVCTRAMAESALAAHRLLGCRDISRSDFRVDDDGVAWLLEVNVIPGMTSHSLVPKAAQAAGISFPRMCERLVLAAIERGPDTNKDCR